MLTANAIRSLRPQEKPYKKFDEKLLVNPNGTKLWRFKYRYHGRENHLALGSLSDVGLNEARDKRDEARRLVAKDIDPAALRRAEKGANANTFKAIAEEWLAAGCPGGGKSRRPSGATIAQLESRLKTYVYPAFGNWPLGDVTSPELLKVLRKIKILTIICFIGSPDPGYFLNCYLL